MALPAVQPESSSEEEEALAHGAVCFRPHLRADGKLVVEEIPLTLEALLDPREGDEVTQDPLHHRVLGPLDDTLRRWLERSPDVAVYYDRMIRWGIPGLRQVSPDVFVLKGLEDRERVGQGTYFFQEHGIVPSLVIEVVSPSYPSQIAKDEIHLKALYEEVGVEEYVLVYPPGFPVPMGLRAFRLDDQGRYREIPKDRRGRIRSRTTGLYFSMDPDRGQVVLEDVATGDRLLTAEEEEAARQRAQIRAAREKAARQEAERHAEEEASARRHAEEEVARLREELERLRRGGRDGEA